MKRMSIMITILVVGLGISGCASSEPKSADEYVQDACTAWNDYQQQETLEDAAEFAVALSVQADSAAALNSSYQAFADATMVIANDSKGDAAFVPEGDLAGYATAYSEAVVIIKGVCGSN